MAAPGVATPLEGIIFGADVGWRWCCSGETPDLGLLDRTIVTRGAILPLWGIVLEQTLASGGSEMERCVPSRIDDDGSWRRGTAEDPRRVRVVLRAQGGTVWHRGGIDGKPGERLFFGLTTWRWVRGDKGGGDLWSLRTRSFLWIFSGVSDGGGRGTRPCLFL
jgi:hypothetical protein